MNKLIAIWRILTCKNWLVAVSKTGQVGDQVDFYGYYTYGVADTIVAKLSRDMNDHNAQENALDEFKNILNNVN